MDNSPTFTSLADLASSRVGGRALAANDDFFASKANLLKPAPAVFIPGKFTTRGKWMDGWESRRRRTPGFDWCVVGLGMRGVGHGVDVDTSYFTGNYPPHCSIDALDSRTAPRASTFTLQGSPWVELLPKAELRGDGHNFFAVEDARPWTHLRLNIFPDGGVARLRVYGEVSVDWQPLAHATRAIDFASIRNGGLVLAASDMHFGAKDNMIMPGRAANMGDGWETRRRRGPGHDWAIVRLGAPGVLSKIEIDTNHYKGNYPESASLEGCAVPASSASRDPMATVESLTRASWKEILPRTTLRPHHRHYFSKALRQIGAVSHVRLNIFPDGGVSRLRIHGTLASR